MRPIFLTLFGAAALAGCGAAAGSTSSPGTPSTNNGGSTSSTISTGTTSLGTVLVDSQGRTLYYFIPEQGGKLGACDASCLATWPPVTVSGSPTSSSGVTGTLGVVSITLNGAAASEVTYNSWPLHRYSGDSASGQANGQGIANVWFAAEPATTSTETGATSASGSSTPTAAATTPTPGGNGY